MPGKPVDKLFYLEEISDSEFPYLIADILALQFNHTNVKVVDGTGDGKRDIFSINTSRQKVITQCKFHYDFNKTSGSKETDEIIIALNKFKCSNGFFCTSGKLSPQSKREYLDNYPAFKLEWLEGHEIVDIVLENPMLRKIWFEGEKIHLLTNSIIVPFIIRQLPEDIDVSSQNFSDIGIDAGTNVIIEEKQLINPNQFRPFNHLSVRNSGSIFGRIFASEAILTGNVYFNSIEKIKASIAEILAINLSTKLEDSYVAIRFGIPYFAESKESYKNFNVEKFNLPISSETFILKKGAVIEEYDFLVEPSSNWKEPDRIHMSQLRDYCFYDKTCDIVFYLFYNCAAREDLHPDIMRQIEVQKVIWKKSFFLSGDIGFSQQFKKCLPDKVYSFGPNAELACWIHPCPVLYSADVNEFERTLFNEEFENKKKKLLKLARSKNFESLDWEKASKIATMNDDDPFPSNPEISYSIVDIMEDFNTIPSPIKPDKREFCFDCVWIISTLEDKLFNKRLVDFDTRKREFDSIEKLKFTIDSDTNKLIYLRMTYRPTFIKHLSTRENLDKLSDTIKDTFNKIESVLIEVFPGTQRATKSYWLAELGVFLDFEG